MKDGEKPNDSAIMCVIILVCSHDQADFHEFTLTFRQIPTHIVYTPLIPIVHLEVLNIPQLQKQPNAAAGGTPKTKTSPLMLAELFNPWLDSAPQIIHNNPMSTILTSNIFKL